MRSLRFKILSVAAALVILSQAGTVTSVLVMAKRDVATRAEGALLGGAGVLEQSRQTRLAQLGNTVQALASDFAFKQAVAGGDGPTIESALANHARRAGADLALLLDRDAQLRASTGQRPEMTRLPQALATALNADAGHSILTTGSGTFELIAVPVRAPLPIGWVAMGFRLTDADAIGMAALTGLQVTLLDLSGGSAQVIASSLDVATSARLAKLVGSGRSENPGTIAADDEEFLAITRPLMAEHPEYQVLFSQSLDQAMAPYRLLRSAAFFLGAAPLLLALLGAILLARALTRPVQQLAQAANRLMVGDYSQPVDVRTGDELEKLAQTFNAMQEGISRREERITYQANHDSLTNLPTRDYLMQQLEDYLPGGRSGSSPPVAVLVIGLHGLGEIDQSLGRDFADDYVKQAADQLGGLVGQDWPLARIEADTFLMLLPGVNAEAASDVANRLIVRLESGIGLREATVAVRPSAGVAAFPEHGSSHDQLLLRATIAHGNSVREGRGVAIYQPGDEEYRVRRMTILNDLRRAIRREELALFYQPKVDIATGSVCSAEALVRWTHPSLGPISPAEFVPIAEQSGTIGMLTRWALATAARECRLWLEDGLDLPVAVNLSAQDLLDRELPWVVSEILRDHDLTSRSLVLEITEEALVKDLEHAIVVLGRLREMGIRIAIDDFGTGYSSLAQIRNLPVDELKIDRTFILDLPASAADQAIVRAALQLAHDLQLDFVAEGVETPAALDWLRSHGADTAQGYFFSRPLPADRFVDWVRGFDGGVLVRAAARQAG